MTHPILEPLVSQLPVTALSRKLVKEGRDYQDISTQLSNELQWLGKPEIMAAEEEYCVRMVGGLQLILDTSSGLEEDEDDDD
jgi:hypothetical protein